MCDQHIRDDDISYKELEFNCKMHEFPQMFTKCSQNIQTLAHLIVSKYHGLPVQIRE